MSDKNSNSGVIVVRGTEYDGKRCKVIPEAGMDQAFPDGNAALVFGSRVVAEVLKAHAAPKPDDDPYAFMMIGGGVATFNILTVENNTIAIVTVSMDTSQVKPKTVAKKRPVAATKPPAKKAAKKTVADAPAKAPAVRKRPTPPAATAAPARKTAPAKKAAPAAPRKTVAAAPAKAPARKTAPPAKKAPARKTSK